MGTFAFVAPLAVFAQNSAVPARITAQIDETRLTTLRGNTHPLARAQYDQGAVADSMPLHRMLLLLQRSPQQEAALRTLLDQQQSKDSPNFHRWLTPQQLGQQFGPATADIQSVTNWLESHGFQIARVSAAGTLIEFSGTAGQVLSAFHTQIHRYVVNGQEHFANSSDPQIPAALAPVVAGPVSLHNFPHKPQSRVKGAFQKDKTTGKVNPLTVAAPLPLLTFPSAGCSSNPIFSSNCFGLGPGDFATIYNVNPLWTTGIGGHVIDGTGETIAIVGDSEICTQSSPDWMSSYIGPSGTTVTCNSDDVAAFRGQFGLSANATTSNSPCTGGLNPCVILDGPDPGFNSDEIEGDLDVQWSGAIAKSATVDFVIAETTEASAGTDLAAEYIVDNNLAPVMSESFGECEPFLLAAGNLFEATLWEQASAQGITVIVSAGDSGSANCDDPDLPSPNEAVSGAAVNGIASTPFNLAAGGTDFDTTATNYPTPYWNTTNNSLPSPLNGLLNFSAKSYIPEVPWNDSCARAGITSCSSLASTSPLLNIVGGGGGQSNCIGSTVIDSAGDIGCEFETYSNGTIPGWNKPAYQLTATGSGFTVADDLTRDVPDISLFAADGMISNSFYIICEADLTGGPCSLTQGFIGVGGTSSAAPSFAGIMAMVNENQAVNHGAPATQGQGNAGYALYSMFAAQTTAETPCNSSAAPNSACIFNDVTKGNNSVPCIGSSINCTEPLSSEIGVIEVPEFTTPTVAFTAGTGYDLATGLGSVNAFNLVNTWPTQGTFVATTTTLCLTTTSGACTTSTTASSLASNIVHGTTVYATIGVTNTGGPPPASTLTKAEDVALIGNFASPCTANCPVDRFDPNAVSLNADIYSLGTGGTIANASTNELVGGTYTISARYGGDGTFGSSTSTPGVSITVNPENSALDLSVGSVTSTGTITSLSSVPYGTFELVRADVVGASSGLETATGPVTIDDQVGGGTNGPIVNPNGSAQVGGFQLNTEGYTEDQTAFLTVGTHNITAQYAGDSSYNGSSDTSAFALTVTKGATVSAIRSSVTSVAPNTAFALTAFVDTQSAANPTGGSEGAPPSGMITFMSGSTILGTATLSAVSGGDANGFSESTAVLSTATIAATGTDTITAVYGGDTNYAGSTSSGVTVNVTNSGAFSLSAANNGQITASAPGQGATDVITVTSSAGFAGTVTLAVSGATPSGVDDPTCSFGSAGSVALTATTTTGTATLTCSTTAASKLFVPPSRPPHNPNGILAAEVGAVVACMFLLALIGTKRRGAVLLVLLLAAVVLVGMSCGSGGGGGGVSIPGTTPGTYTFTVTGNSSGATAQSTTITLNVQ